jgi:hypothetical protein
MDLTTTERAILEDCFAVMLEYIEYGQEMRKIGRGFSTVGKTGASDLAILSQLGHMLGRGAV